MKKILHILLISLILCGCSKSNNEEQKKEEKQISRQEILLEFAKNYFIGEEYEINEKNLWKAYEVPLRSIFQEIDSDERFKNCDERNTFAQYNITEEDGIIRANIMIKISCPDQKEVYHYSSLDNYAEISY